LGENYYYYVPPFNDGNPLEIDYLLIYESQRTDENYPYSTTILDNGDLYTESL
jgi:hypothetical protein